MSNPAGLAIARQLIATEAQQQTGFLDLGMLGLTELPEEIHQLSHLRWLNFAAMPYAVATVPIHSSSSAKS